MTDAITHYDIAIIGAGVAGLSAAYFLSPAARVLVLEKEQHSAYHSSGRSAAMYIEGYENPVVSDLTKLGRDFFFSPPSGFAEHPLLKQRGGMTAAGPGELPALQRYLQRWQPYCAELRHIDAQQAQEIVPIFKDSWIAGAGWDPSWRSIDVHELLSGYRRGLNANGGMIDTNREFVSAVRRDHKWQITTTTAEITADILINAAGAWANHVAQAAGATLMPLTPMRRSAAIVPPPEDADDWPLVHTVSGDLYFKPESPGLMVCPQDETPSPAMDAFPHDIDIATALDRFGQIVDFPVTHIMHQWAGLRTFAPDRKPIVGFDEHCEGFYWLAGQGGFGVQTSPGLGHMVAQDILHNTHHDEHMSSISPNRFS